MQIASLLINFVPLVSSHPLGCPRPLADFALDALQLREKTDQKRHAYQPDAHCPRGSQAGQVGEQDALNLFGGENGPNVCGAGGEDLRNTNARCVRRQSRDEAVCE